MDWLANALSSSNGIYIIIAVLLLVGFFSFLAKKGLFNLDIKGIKLGASEKERNVVRLQLRFVNAAIEEKFNEIKRTQTWNEWKSKCVCGDVKDIFENAIMLNHITTDDVYVRTIQSEVWSAIIRNNMEDPYYRSEEFSKTIKDFAKYVIENIYEIRKKL